MVVPLLVGSATVTVLAQAPPIAWHRSRLQFGLALALAHLVGFAFHVDHRGWMCGAVLFITLCGDPGNGAVRFWQRSLETVVGVALALLFGALIPYARNRLRTTSTPVHT